MSDDFPAAHSMDTQWFAVDKNGLVGYFSTGSAGAVPMTAHCPEDPTEVIPIGRACDGEEIFLIDNEIHIGGVGLSPGYWRDPVKTAAAFLPHPGRPGERLYRTGDLGRLRADGQVELIGRADTQIKSRGYRIELGEIESGLYRHPQLREVAVVAASDGQSDVRITAFLVAEGETRPSIIELKRYCAQQLPGYMAPDVFVFLDELPRTSTDKVAYQELLRMQGNA